MITYAMLLNRWRIELLQFGWMSRNIDQYEQKEMEYNGKKERLYNRLCRIYGMDRSKFNELVEQAASF